MRRVLSAQARTAAAALVAGSVIATAALASAAPTRPVARPEAAVARPGFTKTSSNVNLFAGGATLPAIAYEGAAAALSTTVPGKTTKTTNTGSAFQYFVNSISLNKASATPDTISYCQTGTGFGKKILASYDTSTSTAVSAANPCPAKGASATDSNGFSATTTYADFTGADAPLSQSEFTNVSTHSGRGQAVQIPVIAGAVAIFYNNPDIKLSGSTPHTISDASICAIAAGTYTNWNQLPDFSPKLPSRALKFVYRSDGSGTTFSFSNHLHTVCTSAKFGVSQNFKYSSATDVGAFPGPTNPVGTLPASFVGVSGNPTVVSTIAANAGDVGYTEAANAKASGSFSASAGIYYFTVNGRDPFSGLPSALGALSASNYLVNEQVAAPTTYGAAPTASALTGTTGSCVVLVNPAAYANPNQSNSKAYGILGVTNLDFHSTGNSTEATDLQLLPTMFFSTTNYGSGKISTIDQVSSSNATTGFSSLAGTAPSSVTTAAKCIGS